METLPTSSRMVDTAIQTNTEELQEHQEETSTTKTIEDEDIKSSCSSSFSVSTENSNTSTRRNSIESNLSSGLATPLQLLFRSISSSSRSSTLDSPIAPTSIQNSNVLNGLDQLLQKITSERFLELRRIQLGERPVTGGNARASIENFFERAINGPTQQERAEEEAQNRPETVANDVQSLLQLSRVSSAIQNGFRRQLEATLSGRSTAPTTRGSNNNTRVTRRPVPRRFDNNRTAPAQGSFRDQLSRQIAQRQQRQQSSVQPQEPTPVSRTSNPPPPPPLPGTSTPSTTPLVDPALLQSTVQASVQILTESIATDITRLQSLQVVSNMLQDDFRDELENMVQQRVESLGGNTTTPRPFVRSQQPRQRPPIQRPTPLRTINERGASSPQEIQELRQELNEMKQLLRMTMEVQLDTQRAVRQEVAAVFQAFMSDYLASKPDQQDRPTSSAILNIQQNNHITPVQRGQCAVCIDQSIDTVFYQCGHMCACHSCALHLKMNGQTCPMCRAPIRDVIRTYGAGEQ